MKKQNYCLIKDIEELLKPRFVDDYGILRITKKIREKRAIDFFTTHMELYCSLPERTEEYLKKEDRWVPESEIKKIALRAGFDESHVDRMFTTYLAHHKQIGSVHQSAPKNEYEHQEVPGYVGMIYKWHDMTPEEIADNQRGLDAFDAL